MIEFLLLLFLKHYIVDFVMQTDEMVKGKGIYGNFNGILHSLQHAIGTLIVSVFTLVNPLTWVAVTIVDFVTHYHIDYIKMKYGCRDVTKPLFWNQLGLDQLAHYLTYLWMVSYVV